jgi:hypothetical protein
MDISSWQVLLGGSDMTDSRDRKHAMTHHIVYLAYRATVQAALVVMGAVSLAGGAWAEPALGSLLIGQCSQTSITRIDHRLSGVPDSGSFVAFANGGKQVSYGTVDAVERSSVGDKAIMCLVELPEDCPVGDQRGHVYLTVNLKLNRFWVMADSSHKCGGA